MSNNLIKNVYNEFYSHNPKAFEVCDFTLNKATHLYNNYKITLIKSRGGIACDIVTMPFYDYIQFISTIGLFNDKITIESDFLHTCRSVMPYTDEIINYEFVYTRKELQNHDTKKTN